MNLSVWRDVRSQNRGRSGSGDVIVGLHDGNRIWRVSPDNHTVVSSTMHLHYLCHMILYLLFNTSTCFIAFTTFICFSSIVYKPSIFVLY